MPGHVARLRRRRLSDGPLYPVAGAINRPQPRQYPVGADPPWTSPTGHWPIRCSSPWPTCCWCPPSHRRRTGSTGLGCAVSGRRRPRSASAHPRKPLPSAVVGTGRGSGLARLARGGLVHGGGLPEADPPWRAVPSTGVIPSGRRKLTTVTGTRTESDSMGEIDVPADRYWGAQTARSLHHFDIGVETMPSTSPCAAFGVLKGASAQVNPDLGKLEATHWPDLSSRRRRTKWPTASSTTSSRCTSGRRAVAPRPT